MPVVTRYPSQDLAGLPEPVAEALARYVRRSESAARGRCLAACRNLLEADLRGWPGLALVAGIAAHDPLPFGSRRANATLHWWLTLDGRVLDPTRQQFGRGPVQLYRALDAYQGLQAAESYTLGQVVSRLMLYSSSPTLEGIVTFTCHPDPVYTDQGWMHAPRARRAPSRPLGGAHVQAHL